MLHTLQHLSVLDLAPGYRARLVHADSMTLSYVDVDAGAPLPEHAHVHEQITTLLEGRFEMVVGGVSMVLEAGQTVIIPSQVPHSGKALTACRILDVFHPVREDLKNKTVAYGHR
ncbi:MAG TPA: cupin domain-containing protein [Saprospiraceae bacterium]|nr:cupin domain-containing protein [Saprospiraceae bacterium]HND87013.1 cupin domain-containing protein [Saprospiraceae bacterium]HNG90322.1 cupin domain-containing protein [Saprospiraceae bacterium]